MQTLLVTRGEHGMSLFHQESEVVDIPAMARAVYDVTGAGDTVIACFTLALVSGATPREAAIIANTAAGLVVAEVGAASVPWERLYRICREEVSGVLQQRPVRSCFSAASSTALQSVPTVPSRELEGTYGSTLPVRPLPFHLYLLLRGRDGLSTASCWPRFPGAQKLPPSVKIRTNGIEERLTDGGQEARQSRSRDLEPRKCLS